MNTIATQQPSAALGRAPRATKNFNLRAYLAGGAATIALIGAGVLLFGSLAAYVAFNGLPVGGGDGGSESVVVQASGTAGAPQNAAAALGAAPGAVAATAAAATAIAPAPGTGATSGAVPGVTGSDPGTATGTTGTTVPPTTTTPGEETPTGTAPSGETTPSTSPPTSDSSGSSGPVGDTVQSVEDAAAGAGVDVPLSDVTGDITAPVDETVQGTLDQVGGVVGNPQLGEDVGGLVDGVLGN